LYQKCFVLLSDNNDYPTYFHKDFWEYDPTLDTWTQKADFAGEGRQGGIGFSIGSKGYIGLGAGGPSSSVSTYYNDLWEYNPQNDLWVQKANLPAVGRQWAAIFSIGSKGYAGTGGIYPNGPHYSDFWEWDQASDAWSQKADFGGRARNLARGLSIGMKGYLGTGHDGYPKSDFWEYSPEGTVPPECIEPPTNIISWWPADGTADDIADGNSGTMVNGATFAPGKVGQAFNLSGNGAYVNIPNAPNLNPTGSFSFDAWIFSPDVTSGVQVLSLKWGDAGTQVNQRAWGIDLLPNGVLLFGISDDANQGNGSFHVFTSPSNVIQSNQWEHIAVVYDQTTGTRFIYVNGTKIAQRTDPPITMTQSTTDLAIGAYIPDGTPGSAGYTFNGLIDEVTLFNRALSASEIKAIYYSGCTGMCKEGFARMLQPEKDKSKNLSSLLHSEISVYPNPSKGEFSISYFIPQNEKAEFSIYDMVGRKLKNYSLFGKKMS